MRELRSREMSLSNECAIPNPPAHLYLHWKRGNRSVCDFQLTVAELQAHAPEANPMGSARAPREYSESGCMEMDSDSDASAAEENGTGS